MSIAEWNKPVSENISRLIKAKGLKQKFVTDKAGFGRQQLNDMLNGRKIIKPCDARKIAEALGVTMDELYGAAEENESGDI